MNKNAISPQTNPLFFFNMKIIFTKRTNKDKKTYTIYCDVEVNGKRSDYKFTTGIKVSNKFKLNGSVVIGDELSNSSLQAVRQGLWNVYHSLVANKETITADAIKNKYLGISKSYDKAPLLLEFFKEYIEKVDKQKIKKSTLINYKTMYNNIAAYLKEARQEKICLCEIDGKFIKYYKEWLVNRKRIKKESYVNYNLKFVKFVLNKAVEQELITKNPLGRLSFQVKAENEIQYLTNEELNLLMSKTFENENLNNVKDLFIFQCYTGLSYIDLYHFNFKNHVTKKNDRYWYCKKRTKSNIETIIPLFPEALKILEKHNYILPKYDLSVINRKLKIIASHFEFQYVKSLSSHVGRKTAAMMWLNRGVKIEAVSKMLGHSNINTTQKYYAKVLTSFIESETAFMFK